MAASTSSGQTGGDQFADWQESLVTHQWPAPSFCDHAESRSTEQYWHPYREGPDVIQAMGFQPRVKLPCSVTSCSFQHSPYLQGGLTPSSALVLFTITPSVPLMTFQETQLPTSSTIPYDSWNWILCEVKEEVFFMPFQNHCNHQTALGITKSVYNSHSIIPSYYTKQQ